jgi:hypothetical protein
VELNGRMSNEKLIDKKEGVMAAFMVSSLGSTEKCHGNLNLDWRYPG